MTKIEIYTRFKKTKPWRARYLKRRRFWLALLNIDRTIFVNSGLEDLRIVLLFFVYMVLICVLFILPFVSLERHFWNTAPVLAVFFIFYIYFVRNKELKRPTPRWAIACLLALYLTLQGLSIRHLILGPPAPSGPAAPTWKTGDPVERPPP